MANHDILDNITHKDVKVITQFDEVFSEKTNSALLFPTEIKDAQRDYPILFIKNPETGQFQRRVSVCLFLWEMLGRIHFLSRNRNLPFRSAVGPGCVKTLPPRYNLTFH